MAGKEPEVGATARTVADNIKRFREAQNMNFTQLAERLGAVANWSINAVGIRRIEAGERRVSTDDLMALAVALDVSPATLLMPSTGSADDLIEATGVDGDVPARRLWRWLAGDGPLADDTPRAEIGFLYRALPGWLFGREVDVVESGVRPNRTRSVVRYGSERELSEHADGND
jgi:transcriptional regulator with XRE-family HTH domain